MLLDGLEAQPREQVALHGQVELARHVRAALPPEEGSEGVGEAAGGRLRVEPHRLCAQTGEERVSETLSAPCRHVMRTASRKPCFLILFFDTYHRRGHGGAFKGMA